MDDTTSLRGVATLGHCEFQGFIGAELLKQVLPRGFKAVNRLIQVVIGVTLKGQVKKSFAKDSKGDYDFQIVSDVSIQVAIVFNRNSFVTVDHTWSEN
jgi:hypothetical protein